MSILKTIKGAVSQFSADGAVTLGAALSFYLVLSLAPLVVVILSVAGLVWGREAASQQLMQEASRFVGTQGAQAIQTVVAHAQRPGTGKIALFLGIVASLFGATGVFVQLQYSLNTIWDVEPDPNRGVLGYLWDRLISLLMLLGIGLLLLASLVLSAVLAALNTHLTHLVGHARWTWQALDAGLSIVVSTVLFAMIFKLLPYVQLRWRHVWVGAAITAVLYTIGKFFIGLYLGYSTVASAYGAAGSLILLLLWVYYSSLILFFGAELTQAYMRERGEEIRPAKNAIQVEHECKKGEERAEKGEGRREK